MARLTVDDLEGNGRGKSNRGDFISAKSEIDSIAQKRDQVLNDAAKLIMNTMVSRINRNGRTDQTRKDLDALLSVFSTEEKLEIMIRIFYKMC